MPTWRMAWSSDDRVEMAASKTARTASRCSSGRGSIRCALRAAPSHSLRENAKTIAGVRSRATSMRSSLSSSGECRLPRRAA